MARFRIHSVNSAFDSYSAFFDATNAADALGRGILAAQAMAAEDIKRSCDCSTIVVSVLDEKDDVMLRSAVTVAVSPLLTN